MLVIGAGFAAAAYFSYVAQNTGPEATAKVTSCSGSYGTGNVVSGGGGVVCQASWVAGGSLVGGHGHVVVGQVEDADDSDAGKSISVHLHGGAAYPTKNSLSVPIVFLVFALPSLYIALRTLLFGAPDKWGIPARKAKPATT